MERACPYSTRSSRLKDLSLREDKHKMSETPTTVNTYALEHSNRVLFMVMRHFILEGQRGNIPDKIKAKQFLEKSLTGLLKSDKEETCTLLVNMCFIGKGNIR